MAQRETPHPEPDSAAEIQPVVGNTLHVVLVEDSEDDALLILEELRNGGYDLCHRRVHSREGLWEVIKEREWDVVISDHNLPSFSAIEALLLLIQSGRDIPFIIVSGTISEELAVEAMKAGASDFIMKNCLGKLVPAVGNAVHAVKARRLNRQAQVEILDSHAQLRRLTSHLQSVREQERARIAREIHDELGGILTALKMDVGWLARRYGDNPEILDKLRSMTGLTDGAIKTMRRIITDLRPSVLDDLGLIAAIEWQLREFQGRMGLKTVLHLGDSPDVTAMQFGEKIAVTAFRILQESLTNIARHANATRVEVDVASANDRLVVSVRDDGCGIDPAQRKSSSYGLLGMYERAHHLGGTVEITSELGEGTCVKLLLPLGGAEEDGA